MKYSNLNVNDLVEGEVYVALCINEKWNSIFKCSESKTRKNSTRLYLNGHKFQSNLPNISWIIEVKFREATYEELKWHEACVRANKLVPKEKIQIESNYEIY
jgi:hypothetical protein